MAKNSLFALLLRSPWWASALIALVLGLLGMALLPPSYRSAGAFIGLPFAVIAVLALRRQWQLPGAGRVQATQQALAAMNWPAFADLLEQVFRRDGWTVRRISGGVVDLELERQGRRRLVSARRWKSAHSGLEPLRALQAAREAADAADALFIGLGPLTDTAQPFAERQGIEVWQAAELTQALRDLPLDGARRRAAGASGRQ